MPGTTENGQEVEATDGTGGEFDAPSGERVTRSSRHGCSPVRADDAGGVEGPQPHAAGCASRTPASAGPCRRAAPGVQGVPCGRSPNFTL